MSTQIKDKAKLMEYKTYKVLKFKGSDGKEGVIHENGEDYKEGEEFVTTGLRAQQIDPDGKKIAEVKSK